MRDLGTEVCNRCIKLSGNEVLEMCNNTEKCLTAYHGYCRCGYEYTVKQKDTKIDYKTNYTPNHNWDMIYMTCPNCGEKNIVAGIANEDDDRERLARHNSIFRVEENDND